jgi:ubiquinone/menaquinone biosynthesis C-methylase UbiE
MTVPARPGPSSFVAALSYPDFVAFAGQLNSPPGGERTYADWMEMGNLYETSILLDLACSTGLTSRTLAAQSGCSAVGVDLSLAAVGEARRRAASKPLAYIQADAAQLPFADRAFTHVAAGSSFGFIAERARALDQIRRVLQPEGRLLIACRHYVDIPPDGLLDKVEQVVGYRPDPRRDYDWWQRFFGRAFARSDERHYVLPSINVAASVQAMAQHLREADHPLSRHSQLVVKACLARFARDRSILADHDAYQALAVMCWWNP